MKEKIAATILTLIIVSSIGLLIYGAAELFKLDFKNLIVFAYFTTMGMYIYNFLLEDDED